MVRGWWSLPRSRRRSWYQAVASALGVPEQPGRLLLQTLGDALRPKEDAAGGGQLRAPRGRLRQAGDALLDACPSYVSWPPAANLLVSGRSPWTRLPLSLPNAGGDSSVSDLMSSEAVRLLRSAPNDGSRLRPARQKPARWGRCAGSWRDTVAIELAAARMTVWRRSGRRKVGGLPEAVDGGRPRPRTQAPNAQGDAGVEPRTARRARADILPLALGVRGGLDPGGSGRGVLW